MKVNKVKKEVAFVDEDLQKTNYIMDINKGRNNSTLLNNEKN